jgi:N-formylmaleamate deformylase
MGRALIRMSVAFIALAAADLACGAASFRVDVSGRGRPIVFIPGVASSGDVWAATAARYRDRYRCHVLTLAGYAGVPAIPGPLLSTARDEIAAYIREEGLDQPIVVGHSLGGTLALDLAIRYPDLVGPLVIVDALPFMAGASGQVRTLAEARPMIDQMFATMNAQTPEQYAQFFRGRNAPGRYMVTAASDLEMITDWGLASDPGSVGRSMAELFGMDLRKDVAAIKSPTLVIGTWTGIRDQARAAGGEVTRAQVIRTFEQQFARLPRLHFELADHARHFVMLDDPLWFSAQLDAFLANPAKSVRVRGLGTRD